MASARKSRKREDDPDTKLSKFLSYVCRHGAEKEGLHVHQGGFVNVKDILSLKNGRQYTQEDIRRVVSNNAKQRFALIDVPDAPELRIRANQGHSMQIDDLELTKILSSEGIPVVVHGTNTKAWQSIKHQGLSRMKRTHIHFAAGLPGESGVISGMRSSCDVLIYINLDKALKDGLKFYRSANNVILSPGNADGLLLPEYFDTVITTAGKQ